MTDYVMVHGARHGSWCWKRIRPWLTAKGHEVFTPYIEDDARKAGIFTNSRPLPPRSFQHPAAFR